MIKAAVLMENTPYRPEYLSEHGLSLYLETERHRILFDTGQSGNFAVNAERLGIDLGLVDLCVLSHGHYDHGGGIRRFLELNTKAMIYASPLVFGAYYHGEEKYIGLDPALSDSGRFRFSGEGDLVIDEELSLSSLNGREIPYPLSDGGLLEKTEDGFVPDHFRHEIYLMIRDGKRRIVLSGCSHKGILNIVSFLRPDVCIGGFHFMKQEISTDGNPLLDQTADLLSRLDSEYYTCHCTGREQYAYLKARMGEKLHYISAGQILEI